MLTWAVCVWCRALYPCVAAGCSPSEFKGVADKHGLGMQLDDSSKGRHLLKQALSGKGLSSFVGIKGEGRALGVDLTISQVFELHAVGRMQKPCGVKTALMQEW